MTYKQRVSTDAPWHVSTFQKWLIPLIIVVVTTGLIVVWGNLDNTPINNLQAAAQNSAAANIKLVSASRTVHGGTLFPAVLDTTVYRSPSCGCCGKWIDYLKAEGFEITDVVTPDIEAVKQKYKVPDNLASCHTALIDGYVIEGHVPADDIKRLLQEQPKVIGLSVPQMPVGTPGMEQGTQRDPFTIFSFKHKGKFEIFRDN